MKKKNIKILLIIIGIIAIIPISVFAVNGVKKLVGPPVVEQQSREEIEAKLEKEKQEWLNEHSNETGTTYETEEDIELQNKKKRVEEATKQADEIIINALTRIYPNKFPPLLAEIQEQYNEDPSYNIDKLTETDYKLYSLIFDAMENNLFTEEETILFKDFLSDNYNNAIKKDEGLKSRYENLMIE